MSEKDPSHPHDDDSRESVAGATDGAITDSPSGWRFGGFEFRAAPYGLSKVGESQRIGTKAARLLELLLQHAGEVVTRDQIREHLWAPGVHVDFDRSINFTVLQLRRLLDDSAEEPRYIETLPREGYRFVATVEQVFAMGDSEPSEISLQPEDGAEEWDAASRRSEENPSQPPVPGSTESNVTSRSGSRRGALRFAVWTLAALVLVAGIAAMSVADAWRQRLFGVTVSVAPFEYESPVPDGVELPTREQLAEALDNTGQKGGFRFVERRALPRAADFRVRGRTVHERNRVLLRLDLVSGRGGEVVWTTTYDFQTPPSENWAWDASRAISDSLSPGSTPTDFRWIGLTRDEAAQSEFEEAIAQALHALELGDLEAAEGDLARAELYGPESARPVSLRARALLMADRYNHARAAAVRALARDPNDAGAHYVLGWYEFRRHLHWRNAEEHLRRALWSNARMVDARLLLADVLVARGESEEALQEVRKALDLQRGAKTLIEGAWVHFVAGRLEQSRVLAREALEWEPKMPWAHRMLVELHLLAGEEGAALRQAQEYYQRWDWPEGTLETLEDYWRLELEHGLAVSDHDPHVYAERGVALWHLGQRDEAIFSLSQACGQRSGWSFPYLLQHPLIESTPEIAQSSEFTLARKCIEDAFQG